MVKSESVLVEAREQTLLILSEVTFFYRLELDRWLEDLVLCLQQLCDSKKGVVCIASVDNMSRKNWLLIRNRPKVKIVHLFDAIELK